MEAKKGVYAYEYPRPAVTTDCVIFGYDVKEGLSVLLIERGIEPYKGCWAFPGGFLNMDETTEMGALRELKEETEFDVKEGFLEQLGCFSDVDRDPRGRVITIAYYALVQKGTVKGGDDARNARWYPIGEIPPLAFDHEKILRVALRRLKEKYKEMYNKEFTPERISELKPNEIFVFGSNLSGSHGGGAALLAYERFGAIWGQGVGLQGQSYGIPTMHGGVDAIKPYVDEFIEFAKAHPEYKFLVTKVGCGIAGFTTREMAPLFQDAIDVENIILPKEFVLA